MGAAEMEAIHKAKALFKEVFSYEFTDCEENRKKLHYLMYALNETGMTVDGYDTFMWETQEI